MEDEKKRATRTRPENAEWPRGWQDGEARADAAKPDKPTHPAAVDKSQAEGEVQLTDENGQPVRDQEEGQG
jgi:hypothetical protein